MKNTVRLASDGRLIEVDSIAPFRHLRWIDETTTPPTLRFELPAVLRGTPASPQQHLEQLAALSPKDHRMIRRAMRSYARATKEKHTATQRIESNDSSALRWWCGMLARSIRAHITNQEVANA